MKKVLLILISLSFTITTYAQQWINYTAPTDMFSVAVKGDTIFASSDGGFVKTTPTINEPVVYTRVNSPLTNTQISHVHVSRTGDVFLSTYNSSYQYENGELISISFPAFTNAVNAANDSIWFVSDIGQTINIWNGTTITSLTSNNSPLGGQILDIAATTSGDSVWIAVHDAVHLYTNGNWTTYNSTNSDLVLGTTDIIGVDSFGRVWTNVEKDLNPDPEFSNYQDILYVKDNDGWNIVDTSVYTLLLPDTDGTMWAVSGESLVHFTSLTTREEFNTPQDQIDPNFSIVSMDLYNGGIVLGTRNNGMFLFDNGTFTRISASNSGLPASPVQDIIIAPDGVKYIGTFGGGLAVFNEAFWLVYHPGNSDIPGREVSDIEFDADGDVWVSFYDGGIAEFTNGTFINPLPDITSVRAFEFDDQGNLWFATGGTLGKFDGTNVETFEYSTFPALNDIRDLAIDQQGDIWLAIYEAGLYEFNGSTFTDHTANLSTNLLRTIETDNDGNIWIGTQQSGIVVYNGTTWEVIDISNSPLPQNSVNDFTFEADGTAWISTYSGAAKIKNDIWTTYTLPEALLPDDLVNTIAIDVDDDIWFGTINGIGVLEEAIVTSIDFSTPAFPAKASTIYPNPVQEKITVISPEDISNGTFEVSDITGQVIFSEKIDQAGLIINVSSWEKGTYVYRITTDEKVESGKIMVIY